MSADIVGYYGMDGMVDLGLLPIMKRIELDLLGLWRLGDVFLNQLCPHAFKGWYKSRAARMMSWRGDPPSLLTATTQSDGRPNDVPKRRSEGQGRVKKVQDNEIRAFGTE